MTDIAELGYKIDSSGLAEGTKALDDNAAAAEKAGGAAERLEKDYQALARSIERSSSVLGDRLGGALDRIGIGTGSVITELQALNRSNTEILASLGALDGKLIAAAGNMQAYSAAGKAAAAAEKDVATASQQLEAEIAAQEARFRSVAQQAVAYAESMRGANLSERALAETERESTSALNARVAVMARAGTEQERLASRAKALQEAEERAAAQSNAAARAAQAQELNLQKLLGQINPTVAALNKLADQEDRLAKARDLGLLKPQVWQQYQTQLDATRAKLLAASRGSDGLTNAFGRLNMQSAETQRNLSQLVSYLATGNFGMAGNQVMQLGNQVGIAGKIFSGAGIAIGGMVAVLGVLGIAATKGYLEMRDLEKALIGVGGAAGAISGGLLNARAEIGRLTGDYKGAAESMQQAATSGLVLSENAVSIASSAASIASLTGESIRKVTSDIIGLADGGTDALVKLNRQYGFLTLASFQQIEAIRRERGDTAALQASLVELEREQSNRVRSMQDSAGALERAWSSVKRQVSETIQEMKNLGRTDIEHQLQKATDNLTFERDAQNRRNRYGNPNEKSIRLLAAEAEMQRLLGVRMEMQDKEASDERRRMREKEAVEVAAQNAIQEKAASQALTAQLAGLDRVTAKEAARLKIVETYNKLADNDARHFDGSMQRLIAKAEADIDKQFNRSEGVGRKNADDNAAKNLLATVQRQIEANQQLIDTGIKVTESERLAAKIKQELDDKTNTMTASTRALLKAERERLLVTGAQATASQQAARDDMARAALTERLLELEKQRREQAEVDLMGLGRGGDATQVLQRQLDIQRKYLDEQEKADKALRDKRISSDEHAIETEKIRASREEALGIERDYQQQRMAMLADWRTGFTRVWEDYAFAARNASEQAGSVLVSFLDGWEEMWVRAARTGKLSASDMADSIIADLMRIAAKQAALGLFGNILGGLTGNSSSIGSTYAAQSFGNNTGWLTDGLSFGGGRARGGGVNRGSFYEVGEGGRPELLEQNGKKYLIPGNSGKVIPAASAPGGSATTGGSYKVEINNYGGGQVQTRQTTERMPDGSELKKLVIDIVGESLDGGDLGVLGRNKYGWQETV